MTSVFSYSTERWVGQFMESLAAIAAGLGLRYVLDVVTHQDLKIAATLIGLWEGIVLLHFVQKMRRSWDPYVAFGVRLFVDFLVTESVSRLVLILLWTVIGMVGADIAPGIWEDTGMRRIWSRFRRDLHSISRSVPTVTLFPKPRTVRFSPSRATSVVTTSVRSSTQSTPSPSILSGATPQPVAPQPPRRKSRWPGALDSETETDRGSVLSNEQPSEPYTLTTFHGQEVPIDEDDDMYTSSSSTTTERPDDIPEIEVEPEVEPIYVGHSAPTNLTPKGLTIILPPTPSESGDADDISRLAPDIEEHVVVPPSADVPNIPDLPDTANFLDNEGLDNEGWENVDVEEIPTPPPKTIPSNSDHVAQVIPPPDETIKATSGEIPAKTEPSSLDSHNEPEPSSVAEKQPGLAAESSQTQLEPESVGAPAEQPATARTPPPAFTELYPEQETPLHDDVQTSGAEGSAEPPAAEDPTAEDPTAEDPAASEIGTSTPKSLSLIEASDLRKQIAALAKERDQLRKASSEAKQDKAAGVKTAFTKQKEAEAIQKKIDKLKREADRRSFTADNKDPTLTKLDVSSLPPDKAVELVEDRLYLLLAPESEATHLEVTITKGVKGRPQKTKILEAMKDHGMNVTDDKTNQRIIRITLPINS